jgi:cytochrome c5
MNSKYLLPVFVVMASAALAQTTQQANSRAPRTSKRQATALVSQQHESEGARVFQQNCSRCHNSPEGFSPHLAGTVAQHMRVRASLSKHDEEELLRFLNP